MTDDEKKKAATSLPPPPTDEIDDEWGSRPSGTPPESKDSKPAAGASAGKSPADAKSELTPPWKQTSKKQSAPVEEDDEDEDDEDEDEEDDEDEDEEDDEDEDEEEERRRRARARARQHAAPKPNTPSASPSEDWIPDWAPWAVLGTLLMLGFLGGFGLLPWSFKTSPVAAAAVPATATTPAPASSKARPSSSAMREQMRERRRRALAAADGGTADMIRASHLLVQYQGSDRSSQTRTKDEAKKRAEEALKRAKKGEDFAKLVGEYSDEPGAKERGGDLRKFGRGSMVPPFEDAAFALKVNEISPVVETSFGYHVIKRTE
jgi:hypothetical protein